MSRAEDIYKRIQSEGEVAINDFILSRSSEELFLDFKRSSDHGAGRTLHQNDRNNLAKAISGFGNSEGGVIIWGIDCSSDQVGADVARSRSPIQDVDRFRSLIENAISGCTTPAHNGIQNFVFKTNGAEGYVITLIPKSNSAPHQTVLDSQYYMRAGSSFCRVPHAILSGMFGRRPQPWVYLTYTIGPAVAQDGGYLCQIGLTMYNGGLGIARDLFLNAEILELPGDQCTARFIPKEANNWDGSIAFNYKLGLICKSHFRLAPKALCMPASIDVFFKPPFTQKLKIELHCGCDEGEPFVAIFDNISERVNEAFQELTVAPSDQTIIAKLLNIQMVAGSVA